MTSVLILFNATKYPYNNCAILSVLVTDMTKKQKLDLKQ
ncbi:hypothetical protein VCRA2119O48_20010 [Vibrio crassostreae]|nr:hypothetical protein VCRA2119O48_20010 [Vibrio crassostreae]CAK3805714.1 hypothetical protein VCRA2123O74_30009 [Vibrio crassostreae]